MVILDTVAPSPSVRSPVPVVRFVAETVPLLTVVVPEPAMITVPPPDTVPPPTTRFPIVSVLPKVAHVPPVLTVTVEVSAMFSLFAPKVRVPEPSMVKFPAMAFVKAALFKVTPPALTVVRPL